MIAKTKDSDFIVSQISDEESQLPSSDSSQIFSEDTPSYGSIPRGAESSVPGEGMSKASFYITLLCAFSNVFLASMDSTMVATLLEVIASDLEAMDNVSWVATSYLLSCAAFQPLFGKISDVFGRKAVVLVCCLLFGIGCLISGLADSLWWLVAGRFIAGIGGGGFFSLTTIIVSDLVPNRQRGLYQGYVNVFFHTGAASGGVLAGIIEKFFGWRTAFLFQVPVCIITAGLTAAYLNLPKGSMGLGVQDSSAWKKMKSLDYIGSAILVLSLFAMMLAASFGGKEISFDSIQFKFLVTFSIMGLTAFYFYERLVAEQPVIPVKMLHNRTVLASSFNCWFACMNMFITFYYIPFYWSSVKNVTALDCGLRMILGSLVASLSSVYAGWYIKKTSKYWNLLVGSGVATVLGSIAIYFSTKKDSALEDYFITLPVRYAGSVDITVILVAMISAVSHSEQALVTSIQYGFRSTGSTLGVSIANAILEFGLHRQIDAKFNLLSGIPDEFKDPKVLSFIKQSALKNPHYAFDGAPSFFKDSIISSYDEACHYVFIFLIVTGVATFITTLFVEENNLKKDE
ncbi:DEKNAAC100599 [Brettanomyces naardenensis]|uniref:DEKNAAC100599 n=1 Tax=Brettanomyces naardenensis TaxID=13370 RepID=A0A448YF16_BRENA|nr:DEKNAAC100599 [Brettanomyces naardenensis]